MKLTIFLLREERLNKGLCYRRIYKTTVKIIIHVINKIQTYIYLYLPIHTHS